MMGPRTVHTEAAPAAAGAAAEAAAPAGAACAPHSKSLMQCLSDNADASACQYYLDALRSCKLNNGLAA